MARDILVVADHVRGKPLEVTYELAGAARRLAAGGRVFLAALGPEAREVAAGVACDLALCAGAEGAGYDPVAWTEAVADAARRLEPALILLGNTSLGMDLAPGVAGSLGWPLLAYAREVALEDGRAVATSQVYGGKMLAEAEAPLPAVVTVLAGSYPADAGRGAPGGVEELAVPAGGAVRFRGFQEPPAADVDITKADILVSVGRGIQSQDNLALAEELAEALGGVVSASRPVIDAGWLPKSRQVGKSGQTVKPKLYLACGISGAPEHLEGMRDAELIIAVNTDPKAPIFGVAHYAVEGDLFEILPALTEKVRG